LNDIPDLADRVLVADALVYQCDLFCTRDWETILQHREKLNADEMGLGIVAPAEWWSRVKPYAGLFS
jgi:hypothetical protein